MIDLSKVRNYYIACGYTDLRLGIDGLAAVVTHQYGSQLDEESLFDLPESQLTCDKCAGTFKLIGKKLIRRELIMIPQSEKILEYYSCTYACDKCEKDTGFAHILTTKTPPPLLKHSLASPSTVADVMTKKYVDGVPLARQEKIWARQGVELSRATLATG